MLPLVLGEAFACGKLSGSEIGVNDFEGEMAGSTSGAEEATDEFIEQGSRAENGAPALPCMHTLLWIRPPTLPPQIGHERALTGHDRVLAKMI
jgi:hypothetical protein